MVFSNYMGTPLALGFYLGGWDFKVIARGSVELANGRTPYFDQLFVTPPGSAVFLLPFTWFSSQSQRLAFFLASFASIYVALLIVFMRCAQQRIGRALALATLAAILSYPTLFGTERGNLDPWCALLIALVLVCVYQRRAVASGILLGLGVHLKLYPLLLLIPVTLFGGITAFATFTATVALLAGLLPHEMNNFLFHRLLDRSSAGHLNLSGTTDSASAIAGFTFLLSRILPALNVKTLQASSYFLWGALLTLNIIRDIRRRKSLVSSPLSRAVCVSRYIPFAVAVPTLSFQYELCNLLLLLPFLDCLSYAQREHRIINRLWSTLLVTTIIATQVNHPAIANLYKATWIWWIPGSAVAILLCLMTFSEIRIPEANYFSDKGAPQAPSRRFFTVTVALVAFGFIRLAYSTVTPREIPYEDAARNVASGTRWNCDECAWIDRSVRVRFPSPKVAKQVQLLLDHNDVYRVTVLFANGETETHSVGPSPIPAGMAPYVLPIISCSPVTAVEIEALKGDRMYSVARVRLSCPTSTSTPCPNNTSIPLSNCFTTGTKVKPGVVSALP
jgi:hypothetical protein